jgi:manganese-dependent inorganic pyrophosphatase
MKAILITAYVNPDLDGLACALAYSELLNKLGNNTLAGFIGKIHSEAHYVLKRFNITKPLSLKNADNFKQVILVDASDLNGLEGKIDPFKVREIIDHRIINEANLFPKAKVQIELVGSAATLIAEKYLAANINISKNSAILLASAIISNTLNFKASSCTQRDKEAFQFLNQTALLAKNFWKELFLAKSDLQGKELEKRIKGELAYFSLANKKIGIAQLEIIGVENLIKEREGEIISISENIIQENNFDYFFINAIELEKKYNFFISPDLNTLKFLQKIFPEIILNNSYARRKGLIMRKQIVPLLREKLCT